jgi:hypothetical protein
VVHPQGHLAYVSEGRIGDVGLDLRQESPTLEKDLHAKNYSSCQPIQPVFVVPQYSTRRAI